MATITERFEDRKQVATGSQWTSATVPYTVVLEDADLDDPETASITAALGVAPTWLGLGNLMLGITQIEERINPHTFIVTCAYGAPSSSSSEAHPLPSTTSSFDTSGGTTHITQSISTKTKSPTTAPSYDGSIGYDGEKVQGTDILSAAFKFSETHSFYTTDVTDAYRKSLAFKSGTVNNATFETYAAGEVLFAGASGSSALNEQGVSVTTITYNFMVSENEASVVVGSLPAVAKKGWEYLWVRYGDDFNDTEKVKTKIPVAVYVEEVYKSTDFSTIILSP